ncbi:MAG TPA: hypothetical protein VEI97_11135 [bacterium]|nr:hypothetical protein [bacterium]
MDRYRAALAAAQRKHLEPSPQVNLRTHLIACFEQEKKLFDPIPPEKREGFKRYLLTFGAKMFLKGFNRRYLGAGPAELEIALGEEMGNLRRGIQKSIREWDTHLSNQGKPARLKDTYPKDLFYARLANEFRSMFYEGVREGYMARKRRLAEDAGAGADAGDAEAAIAALQDRLEQSEREAGVFL